jgi:VWFA-related protein
MNFARLLVAGTLAVPAASLSVDQELPHRGGYREEARVERVIVDAYVIDSRGNPIPDLGLGSFRLRVDGKTIRLESVDWVPAEKPEATPVESPSGEADTTFAPGFPEIPPGRLLLFFFQTDYTQARLVGLFRMGIQARRFLDTLLPTDRVAVLSFDSHLKLRQDFTNDRAKIRAAINASLRTGPPPEPDPDASPSLARAFDFRAARKAVTPEKAFAIISRAARPIVGAKSLIFFGWGLQIIGGAYGANPRDIRDFQEALPALAAARINIFTLDVTDADYHSLEHTLQNISDLTGGFYLKTHQFANVAMDRVRRAISGHYVLVFPKPDGPRGVHRIDVALADRKGQVNARQYYVD